MNFLQPAALALGLLAIPVLLLYMLKLRRRRVEVSSTMLWQALLRDRQANAPWQKLKRNLLLLLQLLILAALVIGLARPAVPVASVSSGSVVILLDASASMNANDVSPSRFAAALEAVQQIIRNLESGARMTIILAGKQPLVLASAESDPNALVQSLRSAAPSQGASDWNAAFALAAGAAASAASAGQTAATVVIISDGGLPAQGLPPLPGEVRYMPIGTTSDNLAISALALRQAGNGAELFASVTNYGDAERSAIFSLYINNELLSAQQISAPAGEQTTVTIGGLPAPAASETIYQARLTSAVNPQENPGQNQLDALALDDMAFAVYQTPRQGRTLLVTPSEAGGNFFLEQVLTALPGITPYRALPGENGSLQIPAAPFDLYVFDNTAPNLESLPPGSLLLVNPPTSTLFTVGATFAMSDTAQVIEHPLTRYVDWSNVHVAQARQVEVPAWADTLVRASSGVLVFAGEHEGRRIAVLTFDLHQSDLPLQVAFPILFSNLMGYLIPAQAFDAPDGLLPGQSLRILPQADVTQVAIASPDGQVYSLPPAEDGILFTNTDELGVYAVNYLTANTTQDDPPDADFFAVNLFEPRESDIRPAPAIYVGQSSVAASAQDQVSQHELWPWVAGIGLIILMLEWWIYHARLRY
ncbi:MAG TPA: BatA and WFA domain-containing protein [Anaerolineales bacterium]|nr:BatA and WFA domain-containing protein [Anaerolineales bacterium]